MKTDADNLCPNCRHRGPQSVCPNDGFPMVAAANYDDSQTGGGPGMVGKVVAERYEITELVGTGGMGTV